MIQEEFKVMEWLRGIRNEHSEKIKGLTTEQILQETKENAAATQKRIEEIRKAKAAQ